MSTLCKPALAVLALPIGACALSAISSLTAPTASFTPPNGLPAPRNILVGFINNTPFRAIFTFGAYDPLDSQGLPSFGQLRLEGNSVSAQINQPCARTFAVGGGELVRLIQENRESPLINIGDEAALITGVNFSAAPLGDPLEAEPTEGTAPELVLVNGADYSCRRTDIRQATGTGLLLFTFVQDAASPGGFRIDFTFVPP